jgi:hypothetical protein
MRFVVIVMALVGAAVAGASSSEPAAAVASCGRAGYSYAGFQAVAPAHGVRADVVAVGAPQVESGHVAAWVGVNGATSWIQVGFSAFRGSGSKLYYEINRPGVGPRYTQVQDDVEAGSHHRLAVLEVFGHRGWWRVWVDGAPVSQPVFLAGSSGRWRPIATAETWDGGRRVCYLFSYKFGRVAVAGRGGAWRRFQRGYRFQDPGYRVLSATNGFLARAVRPLPETPSAAKATPPAQSTTQAPAEAANPAESSSTDG